MGPKAKLAWALQKLEALDLESQAFLESQPLRVVAEFDDESDCHVLRLRSQVEGWTVRFGLMVGDFVHNARSALDQAAWLLACRSNPVEKLWEPRIARKISFPVTSEPSLFHSHVALKFFAEDAVAVLEGLQPYQGGDTPERIGWLDRLWNIDKHRVIHSGALHVDLSGVSVAPAAIYVERDLIEVPPETTWHPLPERVEDGAEVGRVRFRDGCGPPETEVQVKGQPTADIAFGSGPFSLSLGALGKLLTATDDALSRIAVLPDHPS